MEHKSTQQELRLIGHLYNIPAATVVCFDLTRYVGTLANAITYFNGRTLAGLSTWKVGIYNEVSTIWQSPSWYNFAPFNWNITGAGNTFIRTNNIVDGTNYLIIQLYFTSFGGAGIVRSQVGTRVTTLAELGL
jgi:hypothetical protein